MAEEALFQGLVVAEFRHDTEKLFFCFPSYRFSHFHRKHALAMAHYQLRRSQQVNSTLQDLWDFISSPRNLNDITPDNMGFEITSKDLPEKMYAGMIITYKVSPLFGIKINWMTEITHVVEGAYFVDEQKMGPYALWHHQHILTEIPGGVLMDDIVTYQPPLGFAGRVLNTLLIRRRLEQIFDFRWHAIEARYGAFAD